MRAALALGFVLSLLPPLPVLAQTATPSQATTPNGAGAASAKTKSPKPPKPPKPIPPPVLKPDDSQAPARVDSGMLDRAYKRAQATRNVGISLAAPGIGLTLLGGVVAFGAHDPNLFDQGSKIFGGALAAAIGLAISIPGVYFWVTGQDDMDSVTWRRRQLTSVPP
jgi:hypothetical protein